LTFKDLFLFSVFKLNICEEHFWQLLNAAHCIFFFGLLILWRSRNGRNCNIIRISRDTASTDYSEGGAHVPSATSAYTTPAARHAFGLAMASAAAVAVAQSDLSLIAASRSSFVHSPSPTNADFSAQYS
jgi:hypothetical protein